jgi:heat shock protein HslJ
MIRAMSRTVRAALAACLIVLSTTAITVGQTDESLAQLTAQEWTLISLDGSDIPADAGITATFSEAGLLSGSGGCNSYSASYQAEGPSLEIGPIAATLMTCGDDVDAREAEYLQNLQGALGYSVEDVTMAIASERGVLEFAAGGGSASFTALTDAAWTLAELDSEPVDDVVQTANFLPDGTIDGSGGCNQYFGSYTTDGSTLTISELAATRMACEEDVMDAEADYLDALQSAAIWAIDGSQLTITSAADVELVFDGTALEGPTTTPVPSEAPEATPAVDPSEGPTETGAPSGELVGPTWQVTEIASAPLGGMWTITAVFGDDGSLTGNAGCNDYTASYRLDGDDLNVTGLAPSATEQCDANTMSMEQSYLTLLPFMDSLEIEDGMLRLRGSIADVEILFAAQ